MATKTAKCSKRKAADPAKARAATAPAITLVGTYKEKQLAWIKRHGIYNYPLIVPAASSHHSSDRFAAASPVDKRGAGKEDDYSRIKELWLYADAKARRHCFAATFLGVQTRAEFLAANPTYAKLSPGKGHAEKYLVFKTEYLDYGPRLDDSIVHVRTSDFTKSRAKKVAAAIKSYEADGEFGSLADYLPSDLAELPRQRLRVREAAVQLDFLYTLDDADKIMSKFRHRENGDTTLRFIDLFAGIGGVRKGFEQACADKGLKAQCVFTSEIKPHAIEVLKQNHPDEYIHGDITQVNENEIPDFDVLLGGFPCQAFSAAGKRLGFEDTRGTLFFDVARILKAKKPLGFVLENVEGLVNHDKRNANDPYGHTLAVILATLEELGYRVSWRVLNASDFGVPQDRKRIYIVGAKKQPNLDSFSKKKTTIASVLEQGLETAKSKFIDKLLSHYRVDELLGKAIKDKRGGSNNIEVI